MKEALRPDSVVEMPLPDGTYQKYRISETTTVDPALLEKYPHLRTFSGKGVDEPSATARFDQTAGFHGYLFTTGGSVRIDPVQGIPNCYICYYKKDAANTKQPFELSADSIPHQE
jgi:hypothetical protein